jgi:hypothetical protein
METIKKQKDEIENKTEFIKTVGDFCKYIRKDIEERPENTHKCAIVMALDGQQAIISTLGNGGDIIDLLVQAALSNETIYTMLNTACLGKKLLGLEKGGLKYLIDNLNSESDDE